jgi:hypothetical protein
MSEEVVMSSTLRRLALTGLVPAAVLVLLSASTASAQCSGGQQNQSRSRPEFGGQQTALQSQFPVSPNALISQPGFSQNALSNQFALQRYMVRQQQQYALMSAMQQQQNAVLAAAYAQQQQQNAALAAVVQQQQNAALAAVVQQQQIALRAAQLQLQQNAVPVQLVAR